MISTEDDNLSINEEKDDEFQEKLDFEENEIILDDLPKDVKSVSQKNENEKEEKNFEIKKEKSKIINLRCVKTEDGELNDDEDTDNELEEGELKDDKDDNNPINQSLDYLINKKDEKKKVPCRFYLNGTCSWGENCRFAHVDTVKTGNFIKPPTNNRINQNYFSKSQFNKYNSEFDDRNNLDSRLDYDDQDSFNNRRDVFLSRDKFYNTQAPDKDYERKRRLAIESAPWNNQDLKPDFERKIDYRKSNYLQMDYEYNYTDAYKISRNRHSSSSSFTVSDFSSSDSEKSKKPPINNSKEKKRITNDNVDEQYSSINYQSNHLSRRKEKYDNDDANSTSSSFFTDSGSLNNELEDKNEKLIYKSRSPSPSKKHKSKEYYHHSRESSRSLDLKTRHNSHSKHHQSSSSRRKSIEREKKKQPIKMTFMRKQSSLKKGVKLNGSRDEFESEGTEEFDLYGGKDVLNKKIEENYSREKLLKRLKEIDEAIAKKRSKQA